MHIEIAHDLTSKSFIQAFTRFVSRRGPPIEVYSANGTNFKGAVSEIKPALENGISIESTISYEDVG